MFKHSLYRVLLSGVFFASLLSGCRCSSASDTAFKNSGTSNKVHLAIWSNVLTPEIMQRFKDETGIEIVISNYSSNEELLAKMQAGATGFDVAVPSDYMVSIMKKLDLIEPIERAKISNFMNLLPDTLNKPFDPENSVSIPYSMTFTGIATNARWFKAAVPSWKFFFEDKSLDGKVSMLDDVREALGAAVKVDGGSLNARDDKVLKQAEIRLLALRPRIKAFTSEPLDAIKSGEVAVSQMYSCEALQAKRDTNGQVQFFLPTEGSTLAIDSLVIPRGAEHKDAAYQLIDFFLRPEINLEIVKQTRLAPVLKGVRELLPEDLQKEPGIFPSPDQLNKMEMLEDIGEATSTWERIWTQVKSS